MRVVMHKICLMIALIAAPMYANNSLYQAVQKLPKVELHLHLGGSYPLSYLQTIATPEQYTALERGIARFVDGVEYAQAFFVFELISNIVNTNQKIQDGTYALCNALKDDGVVYAEIRTGLKDLGSGCEDYLQAVLAGIKQAQSDTFTAKLLLSVKRTSRIEYVQATIALACKYKDRGVVGIDISDNSLAGDITPLIPLLQEAKHNGLAIVAHIGESAHEKDQMLILEALQPDRIGHGVHLSPEARAYMVERTIPLEMCLSSSVCAQMVDAYAQHPGLQLYQEGHPVVICTDDPLIFRTTLTHEYALFAQQMHLSLAQVEEAIHKSHRYRIGVSTSFF